MNAKYTQDDAVESIDRLREEFRGAIFNKSFRKPISSIDDRGKVTPGTVYTSATQGVADVTGVSNISVSEQPPEVETNKNHYFTRKKKIAYFLLILSVSIGTLIYFLGIMRF